MYALKLRLHSYKCLRATLLLMVHKTKILCYHCLLTLFDTVNPIKANSYLCFVDFYVIRFNTFFRYGLGSFL